MSQRKPELEASRLYDSNWERRNVLAVTLLMQSLIPRGDYDLRSKVDEGH